MSKWTRSVCALAAALLVVAAPAAAQDEPSAPYEQHEGAAWEEAFHHLLLYMSDDAASRLILVAYQSLAADLCENIEVDPIKFKPVGDALHPSNWDDLSEADRTEWNSKYLANFGMVIGLLLAEHADNVESFCEEAHSVAVEGGDLVIVKAAAE